MTAAQPPQNLPLAGAIDEEQAETGRTDADETARTGPAVGASDAEADAVRSGADAGPEAADATRDSDGTPVGRGDLEADQRDSGA